MLAVIILVVRYLIVICLFAFVGWVIFTLWRELKFQSQMIASKKIPVLTLHLENGQEITHLDYDKPEVIIGRDDDCDLRLKEGVISSHHTRLFFRSSQWWVEDLQSTNGTFLNDERVETVTVIIKGDELRIGNQIISVEIQNA